MSQKVLAVDTHTAQRMKHHRGSCRLPEGHPHKAHPDPCGPEPGYHSHCLSWSSFSTGCCARSFCVLSHLTSAASRCKVTILIYQ